MSKIGMQLNKALKTIDDSLDGRTDSEKKMIPYLCFFAPIALSYFLLFPITDEYYQQYTAELEKLEGEIRTKQNSVNSLELGQVVPKLTQQLNSLNIQVAAQIRLGQIAKNSFAEMMANSKEWYANLDEVATIAKNNNIKVESISVEQKKHNKIFGTGQDFLVIKAEGSYKNVLKFISDAETMSSFAGVSVLDINASDNNIKTTLKMESIRLIK